MLSPIKVLLVDPSLYTAPYDAALTQGLVGAGVDATWATRRPRQGDQQEIPVERVDAFFYRYVDEAVRLPRRLRALAKGVAHVWGVCGLLARVFIRRPHVVHWQWTVLPPLDALAMLLVRLRAATVLTVHDTVPFNGETLSWFQNLGFDLPIRCAQRVIVHTQAGRQTLLDRGVPGHKVVIVPHGPLRLQVPMPQVADRDARWTFVLFGEIKPYKGVDLMLEALALLPAPLRRQARVVVAGRPRMDLAPLIERIAALDLGDTVDLRPKRLSEEEMAVLFAQADCFLFPYRQIDASGVYYLVKSLSKWMIATRVGIFAEDLEQGVAGTLVPPGDANALAQAMAESIQQRIVPSVPDMSDAWKSIGHMTRDTYESVATGGKPAPQLSGMKR